ncbi:MAG: hypothetical protein F6K18_01490 [Okeania sp. SIO2C2]|uniref:hypothetical protein n=1 Tax=Okeania sp. SIO2C2 TaxID=2607787 RepID=UPI0013BD75B4|nr:hypothetical protein [Okeania sp. SIO2C2]NEP85603.1 hypothetical protein [Okeania sp. SIO2C2]
MTIALDRPMSPACDSALADDIRQLIDNLPLITYDIERDYQKNLGCEVILIDDRREHWQVEIHKDIHNNETIELLHQQYLPNGQLEDIGFCEINHLPQFLKAFLSDDVWQQIKDIAYEKHEQYGDFENSLAQIAELAYLPAPTPGLPFVKVRALRDYVIAEDL